MPNNERISQSRFSRRTALKIGLGAAGLFLIENRLVTAQALPPAFSPTPDATPRPQATVETEKPWTFVAKITSYCLWGLTKSETPVRDGVVATDPNVIPLGSTLDIKDLGEDFIAEDTGLKVKGEHIDVWSSDCDWSKNWGVKNLLVRVKRWGWE